MFTQGKNKFFLNYALLRILSQLLTHDALNLWLLEIYTKLSCSLLPLVLDIQCHTTTELLFSIFAFCCPDVTLIDKGKFSSSTVSFRHLYNFTPWPESVCLNPISIHTLLWVGKNRVVVGTPQKWIFSKKKIVHPGPAGVNTDLFFCALDMAKISLCYRKTENQGH